MTTTSPGLPITLGHYRIAEKIGAGGMGEVYRAHDERLDRDVAVKLLPPGVLADDTARKHFHKEALALSKLNHPNIETVHDFDSEQGRDFVVTEYISGESLDQKLASGALPAKDIERLGAQLADGLVAAHEQNIIHRDLKPSNLRVTPDGRLKILDFGLAKLTTPVSFDAATTTSSESMGLAGTLPYMAPEQVRGEKLDARTDIWAAGAVLYEMASGQRPFRATGLDVLQQILNQAPAAPSTLNPWIPSALDAIVAKCLDKDADRRYQSAKELAVDLRRLQTATPSAVQPAVRHPTWWYTRLLRVVLSIAVLLLFLLAFNVGDWRDRLRGQPEGPPIKSLAVLPLANVSGDPAEEYFADGMTEEITNTLGKVSALRVISRQSVVRYKKTQETVPEIARELNVDGVVEGTVLRSGNKIRISAQLIQARPEKHLWAESYERDLRDVLALQSEIAQGIAGRIRATLTAHEEARLAATRRVDPTAQRAYLKGRYFINRWPADDFPQCAQYLEAATESDPSYAEAYAALAVCYSLMGWSMPPKLIFPKAKVAAQRSLEIDNKLSEGHVALGNAQMFFDWNWASAEEQFKRGVDLNPSNVLAHAGYSNILLFTGRFDEALAEARKAVELDPASLLTNRNLTFVSMLARRYDDAIAQAKATLELAPSNTPAQFDVAWTYLLKGATAQAREEAARFGFADHPFLVVPTKRIEALKRLDTEVWSRAPQQGTRREGSNLYVDPFYIAMQYAHLGKKELALDWLNKAYDERSAMMVQLKVSPDLDGLRSEPRFQELVQRMNFPP